jgi:hypothetical protein
MFGTGPLLVSLRIDAEDMRELAKAGKDVVPLAPK